MTSRLLNLQGPAVLLWAAALIVGCNDAARVSGGPTDESALRPHGSRKVQVVFTEGTPTIAGSGAAGLPAHPGPAQPDPAMMARDDAQEGTLSWAAPPSWIASAPASQMRLAQYSIPKAAGDDADAELAVFHLGPSGGGGVDETFKRWQASFDEEAVKGAKRSERKAGSIVVQVLEVGGKYRTDSAMAMAGADAAAPAGEKPGMRMLGAIVSTARGPYYFKLIGPDKTVAAAREDFFKMLDSCVIKP